MQALSTFYILVALGWFQDTGIVSIGSIYSSKAQFEGMGECLLCVTQDNSEILLIQMYPRIVGFWMYSPLSEMESV